MFQQYIRKVLCEVDPKQTLICHDDLHNDVNLLTLVKKKKSTFPPIKYEVLDTTLCELFSEPAEFSEFKETTVIKNYKHNGQSFVKADIQGGVDKASAGVSGEAHSHQEVSTVTIKAKTVDLHKLKEKCSGQKINNAFVPKLKKGEVLAFVDKIIFNTADFTFSGKSGVDGSSKACLSAFVNFLLQAKKTWTTSFTVPAGKIYAYNLNEITFKDDAIQTTRSLLVHIGDEGEELQPITFSPIETSNTVLAPETFEPDFNFPEKTFETLQQVQEELLRTEAVLQPLAHLPLETRSALSKSFSLLPEDRDALILLKQKLDQWHEGEPLSWSDCSVLRLLTETGTTDVNLNAVDLLVSAMDKLPESVPSLIAKCHPDTLRGLNQLVSSLKERGQAHVSESLPAPLQDGGELHWLTVFLCSTDDSLRESFELGIVAGDRPGVLLLALCVTVQGFSMMQEEPAAHSLSAIQ